MKPDGSGKHAIATDTRLLDADWGTAPLLNGELRQVECRRREAGRVASTHDGAEVVGSELRPGFAVDEQVVEVRCG